MRDQNEEIEEGTLEETDQGTSLLSRFKSHLDEEITESWGDLVLILSCFVTGLLDSAIFNVWSCFVSMQTGNTIYLGLGFSSQPATQPYRWAKSLISISSFLLGSYVFSRLTTHFSSLKRRTLVLSFLAQATLTFISAALVTSSIVPDDAGDALPDNFIVLLPLALLAFQAPGQVVVSRALGMSEVTTVVLTSAYCDLFGDEQVARTPVGANVKRNRRAGSVVFLLAGAVAGGFLTRGGGEDSGRGLGVVLWVAGGIKVGIAGIWMGWRRAKKGEVRLE